MQHIEDGYVLNDGEHAEVCCAVRVQEAYAALADQVARLRQKDTLLADKSAIIAGLQVHTSPPIQNARRRQAVTGGP